MKHDWEYKKLGEICEVLDSKRKPVTKKDRKPGSYPYYGAMGIQDYVDNYIFDGDYLLVGEDGAKWGANDKSAFQTHGKCWVNNHAHILKVNENISNCKFIEHYLVGKDLSSYITGAVVPKLTQASLISIPIPVPPLPIQEQIVSELDKVSEIIEKKKQQVNELDTLAQSIFYDMFGDPVENEKGWEVCRINEVASLKNGLNYDKVDKGIEVKILGVGDFKNNKIITSGEIGYTTVSNKVAKEFLLKDNDVVFVRSNGSKALIGRCVLVETQGETLSYSGFCIRCRLLSNGIDPRYFLSFMQTPLIKERLTGGGRGCNIQNINQSSLGNQIITLPPLSLQQSFAKKIEAIEKQKELINQSIKEAQTLFDSRMDFYFEK